MILDAHQLLALGFIFPNDVADIIELSGIFLKQARELDQVACFHNTIGDRMIPCLRPMMLDTAMSLSRHVSAQEQLTWDDPVEISKYIDSFQGIVNTLSRQNNHLTQAHFAIKEKVGCVALGKSREVTELY